MKRVVTASTGSNSRFKLKDLKSLLYSTHGGVVWGTLYRPATNEDVDTSTVDYLVETYPEVIVTRLTVQDNMLVFYIEVEED